MVTTTSSTSSTSSTSTTSSSRTQLVEDYDTFLQLLTTQLKHQDPTAPMDTNQFTQQLVQYSQVEQQISQNEKLDKLLSAYQSGQTTASLDYIGKKVSFDASEATPSSSGASWTFDPESSGTYTMRVRDSEGKIVHESTREMTAGKQETFDWNGVRSDGGLIGGQNYRLELLKGTGSNANPVDVTRTGTVTSVDIANGDFTLKIGDDKIAANRVKSVGM